MKQFRKLFLLALITILFAFVVSVVAEEPIPVTSIKLEANQLTIPVGETANVLQYSIQPDNASNQAVVWSSEDESVAVVDEKGAVTGVKAGTTKILVTAVDESKGKKSAAVKVAVVQPVQSISLDMTELKIGVGAKAKVNAEVLPEDASNKKYTWSSSDQSIVQVSAKGDVIGRSVGTASITCESKAK